MRAPIGAKLIKLTQGKYAIVDENMYDELNQYKWFYHCGYARRNSQYLAGKKRHSIHMSRVVVGVPDGMECDHISLNKCDNRRCNLRWATHGQNMQNCPTYKNNTSGAKGVSFNKAAGKYRARIQLNKKPIMLGYFDTVELAAAAYAKAAPTYHGQFART